VKAALLLLAAGEGERFGGALPKPLVPVDGRPMLRRSLAPFLEVKVISEIVVAAPPRCLRDVQTLLQDVAAVRVVSGGATRQQSAQHALDALTANVDIVVVHDAARPLVTRNVIDAVMAAAETHGAAVPALPVADTVKRVREGFVEATLRREVLRAVQTPQAFRFHVYKEAHERAEAQGVVATDDAALVEYFELSQVAVVDGSPRNIKITRPDDLALAEFYLCHP
jgi:2-C-methyl-D-erythritol 4-phosphate cytidylyltransferase